MYSIVRSILLLLIFVPTYHAVLILKFLRGHGNYVSGPPTELIGSAAEGTAVTLMISYEDNSEYTIRNCRAYDATGASTTFVDSNGGFIHSGNILDLISSGTPGRQMHYNVLMTAFRLSQSAEVTFTCDLIQRCTGNAACPKVQSASTVLAVHSVSSGALAWYIILIIVISIIIVIVGVMMIIIFCVRRRNEKKDTKTENGNVPGFFTPPSISSKPSQQTTPSPSPLRVSLAVAESDV